MAPDEGIESILTEAVIGQLISETQNTKDRCVLCKKETEYEESAQANNRIDYVDWSQGLICVPCYTETHVLKKNL